MEVLRYPQAQHYRIVLPQTQGFTTEPYLLLAKPALPSNPVLSIKSSLAVPSYEQPSVHIYLTKILQPSRKAPL